MAFTNTLLTAYVWIVVCLHLLFLLGIARFYENKSGQPSRYWYFFIPTVLFLLAMIRYLNISPQITGDVWGDLLRFVAGTLLMFFGFRLLILMMGRRP